MRLRSLAALVVLVASLGTAAAAPLSPRVLGWEQYFKLEWGPAAETPAVVRGYIKNEWGFPARRIQLLVEGLDAAGQVTSQTIGWIHGDLTPGMRAEFSVPVTQAAPTYRVSVFAWDWVQAGGDHQ